MLVTLDGGAAIRVGLVSEKGESKQYISVWSYTGNKATCWDVVLRLGLGRGM